MSASYLDTRRARPTSLVIVVALHGAAITALALSKSEIFVVPPPVRTEIFDVPQPKPPEPVTVPEPQPQPRDSFVDRPKPPVDLNRQTTPTEAAPDSWRPIPMPPGPIGEAIDPKPQPAPIPTPIPPVRVEARMASGVELQPPYPAAEESAGREGNVTVRLTISPAGRVTAVERVAAASAAFFRATERHALRSWRFTPATLDGRPVASTKTVTVHFRLDG